MAESPNNRPTRTLSDIRPPSQATPTVPARPAKASAKSQPAAQEPVIIDEPKKVKSPRAKSPRRWLKVVLTIAVILALLAAVAGAYIYIFSSEI